MSNNTTSMPNSSAAHQALSSIPGMSAPALNRSKSASATSSLSSNLMQSSSHVKLGRRGSVGSTQVLQEAREEEVIPPARSASNSRQQANGNPATGYLEAKVVILGSQGVGKTSLVHRYTTGQYSTSLASTIGASFLTKKIVLPECKIRLQIWDTAGQERFRSMAAIYYRGSQAALLVYDITNMDSFNDIKIWLDELRKNMTSDLIVHVVGAKSDLRQQRAVPLDFAKKQVKSWVATNHSPGVEPSSPGVSTSGAGSYFDAKSNANGSSQARGSSRALSGLGFGRARRSEDAQQFVDFEEGPGWCEADVSEVSAKDDYGVEDLFLLITTRLVARKTQIERDRVDKARNSILLTAESQQQPQQAAGYACC